jgi:hypothetical protein
MPNLVNAYVLYDGTSGIYVGNDIPAKVISINCERLQAYSPRPVWLKRFLAPGDGTVILYESTFNPNSDELADPNILTGLWIEQDGKDTMIDVTTVAVFQAACDACCGAVPAIMTSNYNGNPTQFAGPTLNTLCIYRADDGSAGAHDDFADDYVGQFVGIAQLRSNFSFLSHYTITTYWTSTTFPLQGTDTVNNTGVCAS